jgi:hypothetical protein
VRFLFPQISRDTARQLLEDIGRNNDAPHWSISHPDQIYSPLGGHRVPESVLRDLRERGVEAVESVISAPRLGASVNGDIDRALMHVLSHEVRITPHEATRPGVWQFLCCVLLPDVVHRRFHRNDGKLTEERFLGGHRNALRRLWWRGFIFGSDGLAERLLEDELVQIMERPTIAGNQVLARALAQQFLRRVESSPEIHRIREGLMRQAARRILRVGAVISLDALDQLPLEELVGAQLDSALEGLLSDPPSPDASV